MIKKGHLSQYRIVHCYYSKCTYKGYIDVIQDHSLLLMPGLNFYCLELIDSVYCVFLRQYEIIYCMVVMFYYFYGQFAMLHIVGSCLIHIYLAIWYVCVLRLSEWKVDVDVVEESGVYGQPNCFFGINQNTIKANFIN